MNSQICMTMPDIRIPDDLSLRDRSVTVAVVVLIHVLLFAYSLSSFDFSTNAPREMTISMAMQSPQPVPAVQKKPPEEPLEKPKPVKPEPVPQPAEPDIPAETPEPPVESAPAQPETVTSALPDVEPDYQASYLNNPKPGYPMVARRMGWQGKVVLNVEVLETGLPGEIKLHQSSGRDVLDNAAMQAVRGWRFVPARKNGQVVTKWFLVPIPFILKESE